MLVREDIMTKVIINSVKWMQGRTAMSSPACPLDPSQKQNSTDLDGLG
jgi:hypothetical protein